MAEVVHEFASPTRGRDNREYKVRALAEKRGNIWIGWLEFAPPRGERPRRTGEETSQPNREAVAYWATGLEPIYLEGALERAK
jgi:hypothetical protein